MLYKKDYILFLEPEAINLGSLRAEPSLFNVSLEDIYNVKDLIDDGYLVKENNHIRIKKENMYISNEIIVRVCE